jgi:hypothetical protein
MDRAPVGPQGWDCFPNLRRRPHSPNKGRGRLQRQIARAFLVHGSTVSASDIYRWARSWRRCRDGKRINQGERWGIRRILVEIAEPVGRATTIGRPWIWRLKQPGADTLSAPS